MSRASDKSHRDTRMERTDARANRDHDNILRCGVIKRRRRREEGATWRRLQQDRIFRTTPGVKTSNDDDGQTDSQTDERTDRRTTRVISMYRTKTTLVMLSTMYRRKEVEEANKSIWKPETKTHTHNSEEPMYRYLSLWRETETERTKRSGSAWGAGSK